MKDSRIGDEKLLWLGVTKNVENYVDKYDLCQRIKNRIELLLVIEKDIILVVYDRLYKMIYLYLVVAIEETIVERLARLFRNNMWKLYEFLVLY